MILTGIYEIKHDGFRALAVIENGQFRFFSRKKHRLTGYRDLREALLKAVNGEQVILDGELVVIDHLGRSNFAALIARRNQVRFFPFDLLHHNGEDLRGKELFRLACKLDLEGIVAKRADSPYEINERSPHWIKIKNPGYSQKKGRADLFKRAG